MSSRVTENYEIKREGDTITYAKKPKADDSQARAIDYKKATAPTPEDAPWKQKWKSMSEGQKYALKQKLVSQRVGKLGKALKKSEDKVDPTPITIEDHIKNNNIELLSEKLSKLINGIRGKKLRKDVIDLKTKKKISTSKPKKPEGIDEGQQSSGQFDILGRKNKAPDTRSRDEKIEAALQAQAEAGSPYAESRNQLEFSPGSKKQKEAPVYSKKENVINITPQLAITQQEVEDSDDGRRKKLLQSVRNWLHADSAKLWDELNEKGHDSTYYGRDISKPIYGYDTSEHNLKMEDAGEIKDYKTQIPVYKQKEGTVHLGKDVAKGRVDPFAWLDSKYGSTKDFLKRNKDKDLILETRSDLIAHDDYMKHMDPKKHKIFIHLLSDNGEINRRIEPASPSFERRMVAAKKLKDAGFDVSLVHNIVPGIDEAHNAIDYAQLTRDFGFFPILRNEHPRNKKTEKDIAALLGYTKEKGQ